MTRFAVVFDIHYCLERGGEVPAGSGETDDKPRYTWMAAHLLPRLLEELRAHGPEYVFCTGDISEGGRAPEGLLRRELAEAFGAFSNAGLPVLNALGTHEPNRFYPEIAWPLFSSILGREISASYFALDIPAGRFVLLDYLHLAPGTEQAKWMEDQFASTPEGQPLFLFAHAPYRNFARPFFSHQPMQEVFDAVFSRRAPSIYFCGHTHNQALTHHRRRGGQFVQIKGSSVGFPDGPAEPLEERHVLLMDDDDTFFWGVPEDHCPGYWILDVDGASILGRWYGVGRGLVGEVELTASGHMPRVIQGPEFPVERLTEKDLPLVQEASLEAFLHGDARGDFGFRVNGHRLGTMPANGSYAARRSLPLNKAALASLSVKNEIAVRSGSSRSWLLGAARFVARTFDGRRLVSPIPPVLYAAGDYAKRQQQDARLQQVPGSDACFCLMIPAGK